MLRRVTSTGDLNSILRQYSEEFEDLWGQSRELGFDYCATGVQLPFPLSTPKTFFYSNYRFCWQTRYGRSSYDDTDRATLADPREAPSGLWYPACHLSLSFLDESAPHKLIYGVTLGLPHASGARGILSVGRSDHSICQDELERIWPDIVILGDVFKARLLCKLLQTVLPESHVQLTPREREVLRWTADGKTCEEVGRILSLSVNTVNFHVSNAMKKLNAVNKAHSVAKAIILRLL